MRAAFAIIATSLSLVACGRNTTTEPDVEPLSTTVLTATQQKARAALPTTPEDARLAVHHDFGKGMVLILGYAWHETQDYPCTVLFTAHSGSVNFASLTDFSASFNNDGTLIKDGSIQDTMARAMAAACELPVEKLYAMSNFGTPSAWRGFGLNGERDLLFSAWAPYIREDALVLKLTGRSWPGEDAAKASPFWN